MQNRTILAFIAAGCLLVGWLAGGAGGAAAQTEPVPDCRYVVYGPSGPSNASAGHSAVGWMGGGEVVEPVILLNQCTGDTWNLTGAVTTATWRSIGVSR